MSTKKSVRSDKDDWQTPSRILEPIQKTTPITMDPCAGPDTEIGEINITEDQDGLSYAWEGTVFMNPPFSRKEEWLQKAAQEYQRQTVDRIYAVTPDNTDAISSWHEYIVPHVEWTLFYESRINFIDPETGEQANSPAGGTALHVFGDAPNRTLRLLAEEGDLVRRPRFL